MKLHLSRADGRNCVTAYGPGHVVINGLRYEDSLVLLPESVIEHWGPAADKPLDDQALGFLASLDVEVILIGTGPTLKFPRSRDLRLLVEAGIGFEVMDTSAACRTFNILVAEGRKVAAALQL